RAGPAPVREPHDERVLPARGSLRRTDAGDEHRGRRIRKRRAQARARACAAWHLPAAQPPMVLRGTGLLPRNDAIRPRARSVSDRRAERGSTPVRSLPSGDKLRAGAHAADARGRAPVGTGELRLPERVVALGVLSRQRARQATRWLHSPDHASRGCAGSVPYGILRSSRRGTGGGGRSISADAPPTSRPRGGSGQLPPSQRAHRPVGGAAAGARGSRRGGRGAACRAVLPLTGTAARPGAPGGVAAR